MPHAMGFTGWAKFFMCMPASCAATSAEESHEGFGMDLFFCCTSGGK